MATLDELFASRDDEEERQTNFVPKPAVTGNSLDALFESRPLDTLTPAVDTLEVSRDTNPDKEADNRRIAERFNLPQQTVADAPETASKLEQRADDIEALRQASVTRSILSDSQNAKVAHDSVQELSFLEGLANASVRSWLGIKQIYRQYRLEEEHEDIRDTQRSFMEIFDTYRDPNNFDNLSKNLMPAIPMLESLQRWATSRIFSTDPSDYEVAGRNLAAVMDERALKGMSTQAQDFVSGVEQAESFLDKIAAAASDPVGLSAFSAEVGLEFVPYLLAAGGATLATRNPKVGAIALGALSATQERYRSPEEFLRSAGIDFNDREQLNALLLDPVLMTEAQNFGFTRGAVIGAVDALSGGIAGKALADNPLSDIVLQTATQMFLGGSGEALAQLASTGTISNVNEVIFEAVGELSTAPIEVGLVGGRPLVGYISDMRKSGSAEKITENLTQMAETYQQSPVTERAPDLAAEHMAQSLAANDVTEFYIGYEALNNIENVDTQQLYENLGIRQQMRDSGLFDGDVTVDAKAFAQFILGDPEVFNQLREHIKADEEGFTFAESIELNEETAQEIEAAARAAEEGATEATEQQAAEAVSRDTPAQEASIVSEDEPFLPTTDIPSVDDVVRKPEYHAESKNKTAATVRMSPQEYIERVEAGFASIGESGTTASSVSGARVREYAEAMRRGDKFPALSLDYSHPDYLGQGLSFSQEGRHRALAAMEAGLSSVPVVIVNNARGENINPEGLRPPRPTIRQLTDTAVALAEHEAGVDAMFKTAQEAGLNETQYATYVEAILRQKTETRKRAELKALRAERSRLTKRRRELRESLEPEVREGVAQQPIYQAFLGIGRERLDYGKVLEIFQGNAEAMRQLPRQSRGRYIYTPPGVEGLDPDIYADLFGLDDGAAMLFSMVDQPNYEQAVQTELNRRVEAEDPSIVTGEQAVSEAMEALLETDTHGQVLTFELARLRQMRGQKRIKRSLIQARAKAILGTYRVGLIKPGKFDTHQRREARRAAKALREGDIEAAARHKLNQVTAYEMSRQAYRIQRELERGNKYLRKQGKEKRRKRGKVRGLPIEYRQQIQNVLKMFNFGTAGTQQRRLQRALDEPDIPRAPGQSLKQWAATKRDAEGIIMDIGTTVVEADGRTNWENLTLNEWRDLKNTVKSIEEAGRRVNNFIKQAEQGSVQYEVDSIRQNLANNVEAGAPVIGATTGQPGQVSAVNTMVDKVVRSYQSFRVNLAGTVLNAGSVLRYIDGFKDLGPAYQNIKGRLDAGFTEGYMQGQVGYLQRTKDEAQRILPILEMFSKSERNTLWREDEIEGVGRLTRAQQIGVILNMGNAENINAMVESGQFTEAQLRAIVDSVPKKYLDFAQAIWDYLNDFEPEISQAVRRRQNREMVIVEPTPLETRHGSYKGGYFPIKYDPKRSTRRDSRTVDFEEARDMMLRGGFIINHTADGHTQTRSQNPLGPLLLDPGVIHSHVQQVIYDLEMGDAVHDAWKVLHHQDMQAAFQEAGRADMYQALKLWLDDAITGEIHRAQALESMLRYIRTGTTISKLSWNVSTAMLQPLGVFQSMAQIGKANMLHGIFEMSGANGQNPLSVFEAVNEQSGFMRERELSFNKDIQLAHQALRSSFVKRLVPGKAGDKAVDFVADSFFIMIAKMQRLVDVATWLGARRQGRELFPGDEAKAAQHADTMVARSQGSGNFLERTGFERGTISDNVRNSEMVRIWSLFLSYFAAKVNVAWERTKKADFKNNPWELIHYPVDMTLLFAVEGMLAAIIKEGFDDDDENDLQEMASLMLVETAKNAIAGIPLAREIPSAIQGFPTGGAVGGFVNNAARVYTQVQQGEVDTAMAKSVNSLLGILFRYPASQINKTGQAIYEDSLYDDVEWWEYLTGPRRD